MTRDQIRKIVSRILDADCPPDDQPVAFSSLHQLEFVFDIEDAINFRHEIPHDIAWQCVNDVITWLESKGEFEKE